MKYIGVIRRHGLRYFLVGAFREIRKKLFVFRQRLLYKGPESVSYSQYAEDLYIDRVLGYRKTGVYIDIGANHPSRLSNTKKFYERGWHGVNVEPNTEHFQLFVDERKRDSNLNAGAGKQAGILEFYHVNASTLSTFSLEVAERLEREGYKIIERVRIPVITLKDIFTQNKFTKVDFISIDTEGYDLDVLRGNDWVSYSADLICIEAGDEEGEYEKFLKPFRYKKIGNNGLNVFFKREY